MYIEHMYLLLTNGKIFDILLQKWGEFGNGPRLMEVAQEKVLALIKSLVLEGDYHYSAKVRDSVEAGDFGHEDLQCCIATATKIHKAEPDELKAAMDRMKYTIMGRDRNGNAFYTCGKIKLAPAGRLYFFITAHAAD